MCTIILNIMDLEKLSVHLHAENCLGQNRNSYFIWYLTWRTIRQLHHSVKYSFLIAGHMNFGPDWCSTDPSNWTTYCQYMNLLIWSCWALESTKHNLLVHMMEQLSCRFMNDLHFLNNFSKGYQISRTITTLNFQRTRPV